MPDFQATIISVISFSKQKTLASVIPIATGVFHDQNPGFNVLGIWSDKNSYVAKGHLCFELSYPASFQTTRDNHVRETHMALTKAEREQVSRELHLRIAWGKRRGVDPQ